jgi:hypothetical protein
VVFNFKNGKICIYEVFKRWGLRLEITAIVRPVKEFLKDRLKGKSIYGEEPDMGLAAAYHAEKCLQVG